MGHFGNSPYVTQFILFVALINYKPMSDGTPTGLPAYADGIGTKNSKKKKNFNFLKNFFFPGWVLLGLVIIQLPVWAVVVVYKAKGNSIGEVSWPYLCEHSVH
jgi:hypothetical protein